MGAKHLSAGAFLTACLVTVLFLSAAGCSRQPAQTGAPAATAGKDRATAGTVLSTIADDEKPPKTIPGHAGETGSRNESGSFQVIFSESGRGVAYLVEKSHKVSVVHNQKRGSEYAAVGTIVLSPDGDRIAYAALADGKWRMVIDGREGKSYDTLLTPIFSPDGRHVAYQAQEGDTWYLVVDDTRSEGTKASYTTPEFNADSNRIVYVEAAASSADMKLIVSDLQFGKQSIKKSIGDLLFTTNRGKTRIAATEVVGDKLRVIDFSFARPGVVHQGPLYDVIEKLTFGDDGVSVCYCALKGRTRLVVLDGREELLPKGLLPELPVVRPDKKGAGLLLASEGKVFFHQAFFNGRSKGKQYDEAAGLAYSKDSRNYAYTARQGRNWFIVVNGKEGPAFDKVVTPVFCPDGKCLVYRARKDDKRFVVTADENGRTIKQHPAYEQVFQPVFAGVGKEIAYGVKDGNKLVWKVEGL